MPSTGPETLLSISGFTVSNTLLATLVVDIVIVLLIVLVRRRLSVFPGKLQAVVESVVEYLQYNHRTGRRRAHLSDLPLGGGFLHLI